jgi:DNA-binding transcriptional LysR family regulator
LGVSLFDRTTRKVVLSKYGQILLPYAQQITELQDKYTAVLQSSLETERDILTVGSIRALAQYRITDVLVNFKQSHRKTIENILQLGSRALGNGPAKMRACHTRYG